jgi:hypothetical protein
MEDAMRADRDPSLVDARYHALYRIGGVAFVLTGLAYAICLQLTLRLPASTGDATSYLRVTADNLGLTVTLWVVYLVSDVLLIPGLLAMYTVLRLRNSVLLPIGTAMVAGYLVFDIGITEPNWLALASLANGYGGSAPADQAGYVAAAQYGLALVPYLNALSFGISAAGFLLISVVMLRSTFRRATALFGIATMVLALAAAVSWFVPTLDVVLLAVLAAFGLWCIVVGVQLYRLGARLALAGSVRPGVSTKTVLPAAG